MSAILGISAGFHDASISLLDERGNIIFAGQSERYSKRKGDPHLCRELLDEVRDYDINTVAYYELSWKKQLRQFYGGQGISWDRIFTHQILRKEVEPWLQLPDKIHSYSHHLSHAAAGFQTSPFSDATVVVIDAIGEWETISIWAAYYDKHGYAQYKKLWAQYYPHSIGLFYSAVTQRVGLKPLDEEYITMGMAGWGTADKSDIMCSRLLHNLENLQFNCNLHLGLDPSFMAADNPYDIAANAQDLVEQMIDKVMDRAQQFEFSKNLVYMGGVALNCLANRRIGTYFDKIWIMPNPGDSGSSLGAAALSYGKKLNWIHPYLGHNISGKYPVDAAVSCLLENQIVGIASGPAEFGPRALGNRSLLADPRGDTIKDRVNEIKRRQKFRPFAPAILAEYVDQYFEMPPGFGVSPYMQAVAYCKLPELFPAIIHVDGSSRVQTVGPECNSGMRKLLEKWHAATGCPMLLNTSLNIRGEPIVNDLIDSQRFENLYKIKVLS